MALDLLLRLQKKKTRQISAWSFLYARILSQLLNNEQNSWLRSVSLSANTRVSAFFFLSKLQFGLCPKPEIGPTKPLALIDFSSCNKILHFLFMMIWSFLGIWFSHRAFLLVRELVDERMWVFNVRSLCLLSSVYLQKPGWIFQMKMWSFEDFLYLHMVDYWEALLLIVILL